MIWIDSSFAVEWLMGSARSKALDVSRDTLGILPMQYAETFAFFLKREVNPLQIARQLESLTLISPDKIHLQQASLLYLEARRQKSKASLADAVLAAVAHERREKILSFDQDFAFLGLSEKQGFWSSF